MCCVLLCISTGAAVFGAGAAGWSVAFLLPLTLLAAAGAALLPSAIGALLLTVAALLLFVAITTA